LTRYILGIVFSVILFTAQSAGAGNVALEEATVEMVMGNVDAPVAMIEYSSLSCPHCAAFHRETLPKIKETYIDTGKVKLIYRDFPLESLAMAGAMISRCAGKAKYFGLIEMMFRSQEKWTRAENPKEELERIARFGGMSKADVGECLDNAALLDSIKARALNGQKEFKVESTPTFVIDGEVVPGALPFEKFQKIIDKALAGKK